MNFKNAFKNVINTFTQNNITPTTTNSLARDFLRYGNRDLMQADWSLPEMLEEDFYRGYSFAVIQKRSNKVASLAKTNLKTWANPEVVDYFQEKDEIVQHPYLKLIEDSTHFTEKQFWKTISIYLDLAGRYYLGVVRQPMGDSGRLSDIKEFIMLNPYEVKRVLNSNGEIAGYTEQKKDGRYREWPVDMIIEMRELNPFNPDNSQWSMADAAKDSVFTLQESGNYTRQSLHGNIDAPGIITTDVILDDEAFANFRERVRSHVKGEPIFGNGAGAIKWESMQTDLDKAALMDINNMNREELFAVSGTSKTTLGIEQSGTTRETARVQNENFSSDTVQPRLEDIVDFLNLDYKKYYYEDYKKTGYYIMVDSAIGRDYSTETEATNMRQAQANLALSLIQAKYTPESAYQYAEGDISLTDLELQEGYEQPETEESSPDEPSEGGDFPEEPSSPTQPTEDVEPETSDEETSEPEVQENVLNEVPDEQGWIGATVEPINITERLTSSLKTQLYQGDLKDEITNIPAEENPHYTVVYGLNEEAFNTPDIDISETVQESLPKNVIIDQIDYFDNDDNYSVVVAKLEKTEEMQRLHDELLALGSYPQEFEDYIPHITLCYVNKNTEEEFVNLFKDLEGQMIPVTGFEIDNPWRETTDNSFNENDPNQTVETESNEVECTCEHLKIADFVNELSEDDGTTLHDAYDVLVGEIREVQRDAIKEASSKVTINSFDLNDISDEAERKSLLDKLKEAFKNYWWFIVPIFGKQSMSNRNSEFETDFTFVFNKVLQNKIDDEVTEVAQSHLNTIYGDILDATNKAFTDVVESAAADLILTAYKANPDKFKEYFKTEPTKAKIKSTIRNTDILEQNRKIYDRAYKLAEEGYNRSKIIKAIQDEYSFLSDTRANTIAGNETARAFSQSQYEADYQFLTKTGNLDNAYKEMFSRTGSPCIYCQHLIDKGPIPFTENFLDKDASITVYENGKAHTFTANYEAIQSGVVHTNCHCSYRLILNYKTNNTLTKTSKEVKQNGKTGNN